MDLKGQSAIEYLMTYGWSVLIIALVIAAMFALGVFNGVFRSTTTCIPVPGFACTSAVLYSNGALVTNLGIDDLSAPIRIVSVGCSTTDAAPANMINVNTYVNSGVPQTTFFECPLKSTLVGTPFTGTIWIAYMTKSQTIIEQQVGSIYGVVQGKCGAPALPPVAGGGIYYVPINVINTQSVPTPSPFQQQIYFRASTYSTYESKDLGDIRFFNSTGVELHSWCESNCSNTTSGNPVFWVDMPQGLAAAGSPGNTVTINMTFESCGSEYDGVYAGEAPNLSSARGEYDNGGSVFNFYDGFSGPTLSGRWTATNAIGYSFVSNGVYLTIGSIYSADPVFWSLNTILEGDIAVGSFVSGENTGVSQANQITVGDCNTGLAAAILFKEESGAGYGAYSANGVADAYWQSCNGDPNYFDLQSGSPSYSPTQNEFYIIGTFDSPNQVGELINERDIGGDYYGATFSANEYILLGSSYGNLALYANDLITPTTIQWVRTRALPPNMVMPTFSFGAVSH